MSNIAVSTLAMEAAVIGTGNLNEIQHFGLEEKTYRSWQPQRTLSEHAGPMANIFRPGFLSTKISSPSMIPTLV